MQSHYNKRRRVKKSSTTKTVNIKRVFTLLTFLSIVTLPFYPNALSIDNNALAAWGNINFDYDNQWEYLYESDNFISPTSLLSDDRDDKSKANITIYTIVEWDTIKSLAKNFKISEDTIKWANWISSDDELKVWGEIYIPPVSWVLYTTTKGDTLSLISTKYNVSVEDIKFQNSLKSNDIEIWVTLVIPWAKYIEDIEAPKTTKYFVPKPKVEVAKTSTPYYTWKLTYWTWYYWSKVIWIWNHHYDIFKLQNPNWKNMAWWNCTWFVAKYRNVTWRWNARDWLRNAQAQWVPTGSVPQIGSIMVNVWSWYNTRYWHVSIVVDIKWDKIIVKDMNYKWINVITIREVNRYDKSITWYIYSG